MALVLAATIPAAIGAVATVYVARLTRTVGAIGTKVEETHHQVTVNSHASDPPTVLDRLADVAAIAAQAREAALSAERTATDVSDRLQEHLEWSNSETRNIWRAVWYAFRTHKDRQEEAEHDVPEQR